MDQMSIRILLTPVRIGDLGGVEAHTMQLANELCRLGDAVSIVCADEVAGTAKALDQKDVLGRQEG